MNPDDQNKPQAPAQDATPVQSTQPVQTAQADVYDEPSSAPEVPHKKTPKGVFVALVFVIVLLLGTVGYFIWQTIDTLGKGSTQQQTGGDAPNINGEQEPVTPRPENL